MTTTHRSHPRQSTALAHRVKITIAALALSALGLGAGASATQADVGSVYFDADNNAAAGETFFNTTIHRLLQRRSWPLGDAEPHPRRLQHRDRRECAQLEHHRPLQRRHRPP